jgi:hypothetical protein
MQLYGSLVQIEQEKNLHQALGVGYMRQLAILRTKGRYMS